MISATMGIPTPSVPAPCVARGTLPLDSPNVVFSGFLQANEYRNKTQDYLSSGWTSGCTFFSCTFDIPTENDGIRSRFIIKLVSLLVWKTSAGLLTFDRTRGRLDTMFHTEERFFT